MQNKSNQICLSFTKQNHIRLVRPFVTANLMQNQSKNKNKNKTKQNQEHYSSISKAPRCSTTNYNSKTNKQNKQTIETNKQ